jgi:hypothetical protein
VKVTIFTILCLTLLPGCKSYRGEFLEITKKYLPDNYEVLRNCDGVAVDSFVAQDKYPFFFKQDYVLQYPHVIHEAYHVFSDKINFEKPDSVYYRCRLNDTLIIIFKKFVSIPARQIDSSVEKRDKALLFSYGLYINSSDTNFVTQKSGFIGLLEEFTASYQGLKAYSALYYFLKDTYGWNNPRVWIGYLFEGGSKVYLTNHFRLFISWYLQYCKKYQPEIFIEITNDANIRRLYTFIETHSAVLINSFLSHRNEVIQKIKPFTIIKRGYATFNPADSGFGYYIDDDIVNVAITDSLLRLPEHSILNLLRQ